MRAPLLGDLPVRRILTMDATLQAAASTGGRPSVDAARAAVEPAGNVAWLCAAVLWGTLLVEGIREGAFWRPDALVVTVLSAAAAAVLWAKGRCDRRTWAFLGVLVLFDLLWLLRAVAAGTAYGFLPLGASALGFGAAFMIVEGLSHHQRRVFVLAIVALGAAGSAVGFLGLIWRWAPLAMPAQGLWRLSTTLTYSDAAGLFLGMCLLLALSADDAFWLSRWAVCLCLGGLIATQSRGALVAVVVGSLFVPSARYRRFWLAVTAGAALGIIAVATSAETTPVPLLGLVLLAALLLASVRPPVGWSVRRRRWRVGCLVAAVLGLALTVVLARHEVGLRTFAPSNGVRLSEWSAALRQFGSSPLVGVGPDEILRFQTVHGTYAHFAHNEYLQIAADAGILGIGLLVAAVWAAVKLIRRVDVMTSCATGALACWAVAGAFDFDWHVPVVGLMAGASLGLATRRMHEPQEKDHGHRGGSSDRARRWDRAPTGERRLDSRSTGRP